MAPRKLFDRPRCVTPSAAAKLTDDIQFTLWTMIDVLRLRSGVQPNSVQSFDLAPSAHPGDKLNQAILHRQEDPNYVATNLMAVEEPVNARIVVIDDGNCATMMLESEYHEQRVTHCE